MAGSVTDVTDSEFEAQVLRSETPVLVDFWADWCVPCHMVSPVVEEIGRERSADLKVMKLDVDHNPETARRYQVMSIPTLILFHGGEERARVRGAHGKDAILAQIEPYVPA
ncbi:MAG: thioredoxin [Actinomycetota bacterium]|nr:thioredoxin [Actinomycetota bacterium]